MRAFSASALPMIHKFIIPSFPILLSSLSNSVQISFQVYQTPGLLKHQKRERDVEKSHLVTQEHVESPRIQKSCKSPGLPLPISGWQLSTVSLLTTSYHIHFTFTSLHKKVRNSRVYHIPFLISHSLLLSSHLANTISTSTLPLPPTSLRLFPPHHGSYIRPMHLIHNHYILKWKIQMATHPIPSIPFPILDGRPAPTRPPACA